MDFEGYLAVPFRKLAVWAGLPYNGEFRNGQAAHVFAGMSLMMVALKFWWPLIILVVLYPLLREAQDSFWFKSWCRKNWADMFTFWFGELVGIAVILLR